MATTKKKKSSPGKKKIQNNVYDLRTKADITQEGLSRIVGITRQTIIVLENKGGYTPSISPGFSVL